MKKAKVEIVSQNVIMRSNVEVVDGKLTFPCEKVKIPEDLSKLKPVGGTEDACFVFYNKENQIIARGAIHDYYVENDLRIICPIFSRIASAQSQCFFVFRFTTTSEKPASVRKVVS